MRFNAAPRRRGFSLIELMIVFGVLAIAVTIVIPMMNWGISTTRAAQRQAAMGLRFDGTAALLRADIYQATTSKITGPHELTLHNPDGSDIAWKIGPGDRLARNDQHWSNLGITDKTTFIADGSAIRLLIPPRPDGSQKSLTFFAQTAAFSGGKP